MALCLLLPWAWGKSAKNSEKIAVVRWTADCSECSLQRAEDSTYHYALSYETLKITLIVDPRELAKTRRTLEHVFEVVLTFQNRGNLPIRISPDHIDLELVDHHRVRLHSIDPDSFSNRIQNDSDELVRQSEQELKKHPERKEVVENRLKEHEKVVALWLEHLSTKALRDTTLNTGQPEVSGLVVFDTRTRWLGDWKEQENLVLRIPMGKIVFEFPFALPPPGDKPTLRRRPKP